MSDAGTSIVEFGGNQRNEHSAESSKVDNYQLRPPNATPNLVESTENLSTFSRNNLKDSKVA